MPEAGIGQAILIALDNAAPLACAATMVAMVIAHILCGISARRAGADFALGRLEKVELDRAVLLYQKVFDRLHDIRREAEQPCPTLLARYRLRRQTRRKFASELRDLRAYAAHLRATIITLRRKPLERFRSWLHLDSSRFALSRSLAACLLVLAVLIACSHCFEQLVLLDQQKTDDVVSVLAGFVPWQDVPERTIDTNLIGACLLPIATALFYCYRRLQLRMEHARQFRSLKGFALTDPDRLIESRPAETAASAETVETLR